MQYETDEEKVEAIKKWWKENGVAVVAGAVLGLGAIYGWRVWVSYQQSTASQASTAFEQLMLDATGGQPDAVAKQAQLLESDFGGTAYPALGYLASAKALYDGGKVDEAKEALRKVTESAPDPALATVAALRLARILLAEGKLDDAAAILDSHQGRAAFAGEIADIRGDLAAARGDFSAAREAYELAITQGNGLSQLIRVKIDNLPAG